jgi:hypothetical protein
LQPDLSVALYECEVKAAPSVHANAIALFIPTKSVFSLSSHNRLYFLCVDAADAAEWLADITHFCR